MKYSSNSTVVEHLSHHPKVEGLISAAITGTRREKMVTGDSLNIKYSSNSTVVGHLPHSPKVEGLI